MRRAHPILLALGITVVCLTAAAPASAAGEAEAPQWRLEQPLLSGRQWPVAARGDRGYQFLEGAPNRGLLITGGNKPSVEPGIWSYDGAGWHELSNQCGAQQDGRIAWAGPDDFWTVSDGRPGQAAEAAGTSKERAVPLNGNTLCHFENGQIVASYAHPAFEADSYQQMRGRRVPETDRLLVRGRTTAGTPDRRLPAALGRQRARSRTLPRGRLSGARHARRLRATSTRACGSKSRPTGPNARSDHDRPCCT